MTGQMRMKPPSAATNRLITQPGFGATTLATLNQTGAAPMTITMPANLWSVQGTVLRLFPGFPPVAQVTSTFSTAHTTKMFSVGGGPGTVNWCPQLTGCATFTSGTVAPALIRITPGAVNYGGTFELARSALGSFILVPDPPPPPVSISLFTIMRTNPWGPGLTAFRTLMQPNPAPVIYASPSFGPDGSVLSLGNYVSVGVAPPDTIITGFPMGTGMIFVIDATPETTQGGPFSSSTTGADNRTASGNGNIVLVAGTVSYGGSTGNNFFRVNRLTMNLPEPASVVGLVAGFAALLGLKRARKRS
jgi:hypothetical protein